MLGFKKKRETASLSIQLQSILVTVTASENFCYSHAIINMYVTTTLLTLRLVEHETDFSLNKRKNIETSFFGVTKCDKFYWIFKFFKLIIAGHTDEKKKRFMFQP